MHNKTIRSISYIFFAFTLLTATFSIEAFNRKKYVAFALAFGITQATMYALRSIAHAQRTQEQQPLMFVSRVGALTSAMTILYTVALQQQLH